MIPLLHQQLKRLNELMKELSSTLVAYSENAYNLESNVELLIKHGLEYFTETDSPTNIAKMNICKSDLATLRRGYHPETFIKIEKEKRNTRHTQIYRSLQKIEFFLEEDISKITTKLNQAEDLVKQLILNALQLGLINEETIRDRNSQEDLERIWKIIGTEPNLNIFQKKIVLTCTFTDSIILLDIVLSNIFS